MSDYFAALAARTIQPERGVQPRSRVAFEDAGTAAPGAQEGSSASLSLSRTRSPSTLPVGGAGERPAPSHTSAQRAHTVGDELRQADTSAQGDTRTRALDSSLETGDAEREQSSDQQSRDEHPTVRIHETVRIETSTRSAADHRQASSSEHGVRGTGAEPPGSITPRSIAPRVTHVAALPSPRAASTSDDATTVRVHIGRVDVRAVMPPSASTLPARETRRGIVTLDEYVQQRAGAKS